MSLHEFQHSLAGLAQTPFVPRPAHGLANDDMEKTLLDHCTENLARFKCPRNIDFIDRIPRLPTGKLLRRELRESYHGHTGSG